MSTIKEVVAKYNKVQASIPEGLRALDETSGDDVSDELDYRLKGSIKEMKSRLKEAEDFYRKYKSGNLKKGDEYLDFAGPLGDGYDSTGPSMVRMSEE